MSTLESLQFCGASFQPQTPFFNMDSQRKNHILRLLLQAGKEKWDSVIESGLFAPYSPTPHSVIEFTLNHPLFPLDILREDTTVVDLGCGDCRWLFAILQRCPCSAIGFELDERVYKMASESISQSEFVERIQLVQQDALSVTLPRNTRLVIVYAGPIACIQFAQQLSVSHV